MTATVPARCVWCLLPFGLVRGDQSVVEMETASSCKRCAADNAWNCECCCDSEEAHDAGIARSMAEFLADPGPAPAHFTAEQVERAERGMAAAKAQLAKEVA